MFNEGFSFEEDKELEPDQETLEQKEEVFNLNLTFEELEKMQQIYQILVEKMEKGNSAELYLKCNKFALDLLKKYGEDVYKSSLYYILISGTIGEAAANNIDFLDFEGSDSIEDFIKNLE